MCHISGYGTTVYPPSVLGVRYLPHVRQVISCRGRCEVLGIAVWEGRNESPQPALAKTTCFHQRPPRINSLQSGTFLILLDYVGNEKLGLSRFSFLFVRSLFFF